MARPGFHSLILVCLTLCNATLLETAKPAFLQRSASAKVLQPTVLDGKFVQYIIDTPGDVLVLLYSPTCPDCQWFEHKVWRTVTAKLDADPNLSVLTVADPAYAAPKPFEHDNNPTLFYAPKDDKLNPMMYPQSRFAEYLTGLSEKVRPQDTQDADFVQDILSFAKGAAGIRLSEAVTPSKLSAAAQQVQKLADHEWSALNRKWAGAKDYPAPPAALVAPGGASPSWPADWALPAASPPKASLVVAFKRAAASHAGAYSEKLDADQMWVLHLSQEAEGLEKAEKFAVAYAQKYVAEHPGRGFTVEGVFKYSLPYYQNQFKTRKA